MTDATTTDKTRRRLERTQIGVVTGDKRDKTRTVSIDRQVKHPKYGKYLSRSSTVHVHDSQNASSLGDRVEIVNCRPISKTKSWRLVRIVGKTGASDVESTSQPG